MGGDQRRWRGDRWRVNDEKELERMCHPLRSLGKEIGKGQFGITYIYKEKSTGKKYACKKIPKRKLVTANQKEALKREVKFMNELSGEELFVELKDVYEDNKHVYLVMEHCEGGELYQKMKSNGRYSEKVAAQILSSIMKVVYCLHFMGIMHRDLKPENFVLAKKGASPCSVDYTSLKAIDFGLSAYIDEGKPSQEKVGTAFYVAPEVLKRKPYGLKIDIWSAGVILYILLTGVPPFYGENEMEIFEAVKIAKPDMESHPWPLISENAKTLVKAMLSEDPTTRPTAAAVFNYQWMKDNGVATENPVDTKFLVKMKHIRAMNKFKKLALQKLTEMILEEEFKKTRTMFRNFHTNEQIVLSREELEKSLDRIGEGIGPEEAKEIVEAADADGNGYIDYNEFITAMTNIKQHKEENLRRAFNQFHKGSNG
ncbi:hypothetical protein E3N88_08698 [Mikania micrantha]|uniref:Calcium-dependent protein kinase n=1 Tax=Mikania micrantha TaxID=192012 RepID=A0A5N6PHJ3_9ASTR|nr:hypothetical protein E3N88_08698 [Mikania micrantha]